MTAVTENPIGTGWMLVLILFLNAIRGKETFRSEYLLSLLPDFGSLESETSQERRLAR